MLYSQKGAIAIICILIVVVGVEVGYYQSLSRKVEIYNYNELNINGKSDLRKEYQNLELDKIKDIIKDTNIGRKMYLSLSYQAQIKQIVFVDKNNVTVQTQDLGGRINTYYKWPISQIKVYKNTNFSLIQKGIEDLTIGDKVTVEDKSEVVKNNMDPLNREHYIEIVIN
jgi:outer membrane lipoprotein-sorting protein